MATTLASGVHCLTCGQRFEQASDPFDTAHAKPGDVSMCLYCGDLTIFETGPLGQLVVRPLTAAEQNEILADPRVARLLAARVKVARPEWGVHIAEGGGAR